MNYRFQLEEISKWLQAKEASLKTADVDCSVKESLGEATIPSVLADFFWPRGRRTHYRMGFGGV